MVVVGLAAGGPADMSHKMLLGTSFAAQCAPATTPPSRVPLRVCLCSVLTLPFSPHPAAPECRALPHMTAAATHYQLGNLQLRILPALFAGSLIGSAISSNLAVHVPDKVRIV